MNSEPGGLLNGIRLPEFDWASDFSYGNHSCHNSPIFSLEKMARNKDSCNRYFDWIIYPFYRIRWFRDNILHS
jgi:hypothetical protein